MAVTLLMPKIVHSMRRGTIAEWLKGDGSSVDVGDDLVVIQAGPLCVTCTAVIRGTIEIVASEGSTVCVGAPMARLASREPGHEPATGHVSGHALDQPLSYSWVFAASVPDRLSPGSQVAGQ